MATLIRVEEWIKAAPAYSRSINVDFTGNLISIEVTEGRGTSSVKCHAQGKGKTYTAAMFNMLEDFARQDPH